ncbi:PaaI family thioesterase [Hyphomonas sp.]|uniref:PaaI family thioesterase n=1 Tax=Hyphomonas sp. TaxID=87 RepID=UPI003F72B0D0
MSSTPTIPESFELLEPTSAYMAAFGTILVDFNRLRLGFQADSRHCNPVEALHGGAIATFADMQLMASPDAIPDLHTPTVSLDVDFIGLAGKGDWIELHLQIDRVTRRLIFTRGDIRVGDRLLARSTAIYKNNDRTRFKPS